MIEKNPELRIVGSPDYLSRPRTHTHSILPHDIPEVMDYYRVVSKPLIGDCWGRQLKLVRCATSDGHSLQSSGEHFYTVDNGAVASGDAPVISRLDPQEREIYEYVRETGAVYIVNLVNRLRLSASEAHRSLLHLKEEGLIRRKFRPFVLRNDEDLLEWVVGTNGGYEMMWSYNRIGESYPSRVVIDLDPYQPMDYDLVRSVVGDFVAYLREIGFHPKTRLPGGRIGGANIILSLEFDRVPQNYRISLPTSNALETAIREKGTLSELFRGFVDFIRFLILGFMSTRSDTPVTFVKTPGKIQVDVLRNLDVGARAIGSIHYRQWYSDGPHVCVPWDSGYPSREEVKEMTSMEYVKQTPQILEEPEAHVDSFERVEQVFQDTRGVGDLCFDTDAVLFGK